MSLYRRKKKGKKVGCWCYLFYIDGKRFKGSTKTKDPKEALRVEARKRVAAEKGEPLRRPKAQTVREFIEEFQTWVKTINRASKTIADYENGCRLILSTPLAAMRLDRVTEDDIDATKFHDSPYSTNSALRTLRRALFRGLRKKALFEVPKVRLVDAPRRELMVRDEDETLLLGGIRTAVAGRRYQKLSPSPLEDVFTTMLDAGLRDGEVVRMRIENIHWTQAFYFNPKGKTKRARRIVPLSERVLALLRVRCGELREGWVFPSKKAPSGHVELRGLQKLFRKVADSLGLPNDLKLYCSRHKFGTVAMAETRDPALVKESMGHEDLKTTLQYLHPDVQRIKAVIDRRNQSRMIN